MQRVNGGNCYNPYNGGGVSQPRVGGEGSVAGGSPRSVESNASVSQISQSQSATGLHGNGRTSLPEGLSVGGNLDIRGCTALTSLTDHEILGCTPLTSLTDLDIRGCTALTSLTESVLDLDIRGFTNLTSLTESVFQLQQNQTVNATNTGIPVRLLEEYNTRQNAPNYLGPRIHFSISDYQSSSTFRAEQLPQLFQTITGTEANHPFWQYAAKQTNMGSSYNSFAEFLTRLLNELPAGDQRQKDLNELKKTLTPLFCQMQEDYDQNPDDISKCTKINSVLSSAEMGVGTCIDKVKVGYITMQLLSRPDSENDQKTLGTIMKTVEGIAAYRVIFDTTQNKFIHVARTILDGEFDGELKARANCLLKQTDDSNIELTQENLNFLETSNIGTDNLTQYLVHSIMGITPNTYKVIRIGDEVEDILSLAYTLLPNDLHKINMSYELCCTLKDWPNGDQLKQAALAYINNLS